MPKAPKPEPGRLLTAVELELMTLLWRLGEGGVQEVLDALPQDRVLARTSVSTILRILESKGVLTSRKEGRAHVYVPAVSRADYEARTLSHVVEKVFEGDARGLLMRLIDTHDLDPSELDEVKALLKKKGRRA